MPQKTNQIIIYFSIIIIAIASIFWVNGLILAWSPPSASPPGSNASAPLNTDSTAQIKSGSLRSSVDIRAPIFYDSDNTGYYVSPDSNSWLYRLYSYDIRADIMYDRNNTSYYVNPASTSKFNTINLGGVSRNSWPSFSTTCSDCDGRFINVGESGDSILDNTIDSSEIQDNTLTAADLAPNSVGNSELIDDPTVSTIYASNWFRSTGATGWYSNTYGGGWYMQDSSWIRSYGSKNVYINTMLRADGGFQVDGNWVINSSGWLVGDRIQQNTIDSSEIQDNTLTAADLAPNSVGNSELIDNPSFTIMYDANDTSYYVDPASTSKFNTINLGGVSRSSWPSSSLDIQRRTCTSPMSYTQFSCTADCPSGYVVIAGGCSINDKYSWLVRANPTASNTGWYCYGNAPVGLEMNKQITGYAICVPQ